MSVKVEKIEKNKVEMEITVEASEVTKSFDRVAKKVAGEINVPGFRKGKAPRHIIEKYVGQDYLKNEALEILLSPALIRAYNEAEILPVSRPSVDIVQIEEGQDLIFKATVEVKPEVELGQYTGLAIEKKPVEVTEEQIDEELKRRQNIHAKLITVEDGEVQNQDIAIIDFEGFKDGVPFEGGKGENHELTIGSGTFIPGFEEQLIGAKIDQEMEINVRFPDEYHSQDLAGQDAMFKVKINGIKRKELVPLDDEFAKDVSEFDTLAELREDIKQKTIAATELRMNNEFRTEVLKAVVNNTSLEIPEGMVEERIDQMMEEMRMNLSYQGITLEQYLQYTNTDMDQMRENSRIQATEGIKTELVLEAIAKKEEITVTDEDVEQEMVKLSQQYGRSVEELKAALAARGESQWFKVGIISDRAIDFLVEKNTAEKKEIEG